MTRQLSLFDSPPEPAAPPVLARRSDPATSHEAAVGVAGKLNHLEQCCMVVVGRQFRELTAQEIAQAAQAMHGGLQESYRKRPHEMVGKGYLIECPARLCSVTGKNATTYRRNPNGPGI